MYLDEQLEILINEAPEHGVPIPVMEKAVAPTLKFFTRTKSFLVSDNLK